MEAVAGPPGAGTGYLVATSVVEVTPVAVGRVVDDGSDTTGGWTLCVEVVVAVVEGWSVAP